MHPRSSEFQSKHECPWDVRRTPKANEPIRNKANSSVGNVFQLLIRYFCCCLCQHPQFLMVFTLSDVGAAAHGCTYNEIRLQNTVVNEKWKHIVSSQFFPRNQLKELLLRSEEPQNVKHYFFTAAVVYITFFFQFRLIMKSLLLVHKPQNFNSNTLPQIENCQSTRWWKKSSQ